MVFQRTIIIFEIIVEGDFTGNLDVVLFRISFYNLEYCNSRYETYSLWVIVSRETQVVFVFNIFTSNEFLS